MNEKSKLDIIKESVDSYVGRNIQLTAKRGRKKRIVRRGVIETTYPSIFVVKLDDIDDEYNEKRLSFSYTDILTKTVEIVVFKKPKIA